MTKGIRQLSVSVRRLGFWNDFSRRAPSLKVIDNQVKSSLLDGESLARPSYHSPSLIDETFKKAYSLLENEASSIYKNLETETDAQKVDELLVDSEKYNPEVIYNQLYYSDKIDLSQPVYRDFLYKKWKSYDLMILMQRLETLHVIPDTLPTLDPKVDVKISFPHNDAEFQQWVVPGTILPAFAVSQPPRIQIHDFDNITNENQLYTIVIVNPDTPDVKNNTYSTNIHYGLSNVKLNNVDNTVTTEKLLNSEQTWSFSDYLPLTPEKNTPNHRACLWVFKQQGNVSIDEVAPGSQFNIRDFAANYNLTAVGAHVWRQHFDRSVDQVRADYGLSAGRVFHRVRKDVPL